MAARAVLVPHSPGPAVGEKRVLERFRPPRRAASGRILAMCSFSWMVDAATLAMVLRELDEEPGRTTQILGRRGQAAGSSDLGGLSRERLSQVLPLHGREVRALSTQVLPLRGWELRAPTKAVHFPCFFSLATSSSSSAIRFSSTVSRSRSLGVSARSVSRRSLMFLSTVAACSAACFF